MRRVLRTIWAILTAPFRFVWWVVRRVADWLRALASDFSAFFMEEPEDTPVADAISKAVDNPGDILVHLGDLRKHLIRAALFLALTTAISFAFTGEILELLARPLGGGLDTLQAIDVTEPIGVFMRVALLSGFSVALPYIILELWLFAAPGLHRRSRLMGLLAIPAVTLFFVAGMLFAYFVMLPTALPFLIDFMGFRTEPRPSTYFPFVTNLMFWVGIAFQFPLVIFVLASLGLVDARALLRQSRLAIVIMALVAAMITPTVDPINMFLVWGPLVGLYYLGVGLAFLAQRRRTQPAEAQAKTSESG